MERSVSEGSRRRIGRGASLPASPYSFVNGHHVSRGQRAAGVMDVVPHSLQSLILSLTGTTSLGDSGPSTNRTWCFTPRNPLFFRRRAPRPRDPAAFGEPDVVLHSPQVLILSSPSTTSLGPSGPPASRTWCFTARKPLFLRPARAQRAFGEPDVVLHSPQSLILSSPGTTSPGPSGPPANRTWCFTLRKPLFLRPGAPRPRDPEAHRVPTLKTKAEGNSRPRISLFSPRHRARSVPPQSESTSGPHPFRKCSPFQIRKDVPAEKHLLFSEAHPSHFHKSKRGCRIK